MSTNNVIRTHQHLYSTEDVMDIMIRKQESRLVEFVMNYRAKIKGTWREVIHYDTRHEKLHVHRFWRTSDKQIEILEKSEIDDYWPHFNGAFQDIDENWKRYRQLTADRT